MSFPRRPTAAMCVTLGCCAVCGCANPGPPKPPSLQIPAVIRDLSATRRGDAVELQFTLPQRTSDGVMLKAPSLFARLCRAVDTGTCVPVAQAPSSFPVPTAPKIAASLRDVLPPSLTSGPPRLLTYRVELTNPQGRGAGFSDAAYAAAGAAPAAVMDLRGQGSRLGVVLAWQRSSEDAEVLLRREDMSPAQAGRAAANSTPSVPAAQNNFPSLNPGKGKQRARVVLLNAAGDEPAALPKRDAGSTLDTTAVAEIPYRYTAERRQRLELGGHELEMWSGVSAALVFTLHDTFPPPPPTGLSVAGFAEGNAAGEAASFAVDLIWEPVQDEQLAGYRVYRQAIGTSAQKQLLTPVPVKLSAFHDTTADGFKRYRYTVTAIDLNGNESEAATAMLEAQVR